MVDSRPRDSYGGRDQEALTNTVRHAGASRLELSLLRSPCGVELLIRDDGRGLGDAPRVRGCAGCASVPC